MASSDNIGDTPEAVEASVAAGLVLSIVTQADVIDIDSAVNNALNSGKKLGACFIMAYTAGGLYDIIMAEGSATNSDWALISGGAAITPA